MSFVSTTDLALVRTTQGPILYYQNDSNIYEAKQIDSKWVSNPVTKSDELESWGGPITAYHVENDGSYGGQSTTHVIFKDKSNVLREMVKKTDGDTWDRMELPSEINTAVTPTSKLASGVCHDDSSELSHQWLFFVSPNPDTSVGGVVVTELRRGKESSFAWVYTKTLPQNRGTALESTKMSAHLTNKTTRLYFQNHEEQLVEYEWTDTEWSGQNIVRDKSKVTSNSAVAVSGSTGQDVPHLFFVENNGTKNVIKHAYDGQETELATWVGGSTLGSTTIDESTYLFYIGADKPTNIQVKKLEDGKWSDGEVAV